VTLDAAIERIQFAYPQIYYACHTRHQRQRSNAVQLSMRDAEMLVHLDRATPTTVSALARHMDLARSTVSEAITALERHGYVVKKPLGDRDRRHVGLVLTDKAVAAVRETSVLESARLKTVLLRLPARDREAAVNALSRLAQACRRP